MLTYDFYNGQKVSTVDRESDSRIALHGGAPEVLLKMLRNTCMKGKTAFRCADDIMKVILQNCYDRWLVRCKTLFTMIKQVS